MVLRSCGYDTFRIKNVSFFGRHQVVQVAISCEICEISISQEHGTLRTKEDVFKKWCNILVKYKPIISDKLASMRKTGGGPAEAELTELETKIRSIKGKEIFEGIEAGIDLSMGTNSPLSDLDMAISPAGTLQDLGSQSGSEIEFAMKPPARKRKLNEIPVTDPFKEGILENERQKVEILKRIASKLEVIAENMTSSTGLMVGKLELLISNQNKLINLMSNMISSAECNLLIHCLIYLLQLIYHRDTNSNNIFQHYLLSTRSRKRINLPIRCMY